MKPYTILYYIKLYNLKSGFLNNNSGKLFHNQLLETKLINRH